MKELERLGWLDVLPEAPAVAGDSRFLHAYFHPAHARHRAAEYRRAARALARARTAARLAARARVARLLGDEPAARADLASALERDADRADAWAFRGELALTAEPAAALADLERALALAGARAEFAVWRAYALCQLGRQVEALAALDGALERAPLVAGRLLRGILRERREDLAGAESDFSWAARRDPRCSGVFTLRGTVRFKLGDRRGAVEDAHAGIGLHPENLDTFVRILQLEAGRKTAATPEAEHELLVSTADAVLRREPGAAWAHAARAGVLGRSELQVEPLRRAVALDPSRAWIRAFLGRALCGSRETPDLASGLAETTRAVELAPRCGWIRSWRGEILRRLGRLEEARADLTAGMRLDPSYRLAYAWRAGVTEALGRRGEALDDMNGCVDVLRRPGFLHQRARLEWELEPASIRPLADLAELACASARWARAYSLPPREGGEASARPLALSPVRLERLARARAADPLPAAWLGRALLSSGALEAANRWLEEALRRAPDFALARAWRGEAECRAGRFARAAEQLDRALASPRPPIAALVWRAIARTALGRRAEALEDVAAAGRRDPEGARLVADWLREAARSADARKARA